MKLYFLLFTNVILCLNCFSQQVKTAEEFGFKHIIYNYKNDKVDILVKSKKGEENFKKPLFLFCQGSLPKPLIKFSEQGNYPVFPFDTEKISEKYHLIIVGKPFIPLIADTKTLGEDLNYVDNLGIFPQEYSERNLLNYYVDRNIEIIKYLQKKYMTKTNVWMREYHRYLGFFLAGIMGVYALSGIVLIFRDTNFLKSEKTEEKKLDKGLTKENLGSQIKIKDLKVDKIEGPVIYFKQGNYNASTGIATVTDKKLPFVLDKMTKMHKANSKSPLFFFNIFFGLSLLFFVISAFYMFTPSSKIMKKGLIFTIAGAVLLLLILFI